jgi:hypothetical protein
MVTIGDDPAEHLPQIRVRPGFGYRRGEAV